MIVENNNVDVLCFVYIEAVRRLLASAGMWQGIRVAILVTFYPFIL